MKRGSSATEEKHYDYVYECSTQPNNDEVKIMASIHDELEELKDKLTVMSDTYSRDVSGWLDDILSRHPDPSKIEYIPDSERTTLVDNAVNSLEQLLGDRTQASNAWNYISSDGPVKKAIMRFNATASNVQNGGTAIPSSLKCLSRDEAGKDNCSKPARYIVWGHLYEKNQKGLRCYEHAARPLMGHDGVPSPFVNTQAAVFELSSLTGPVAPTVDEVDFLLKQYDVDPEFGVEEITAALALGSLTVDKVDSLLERYNDDLEFGVNEFTVALSAELSTLSNKTSADNIKLVHQAIAPWGMSIFSALGGTQEAYDKFLSAIASRFSSGQPDVVNTELA